MQKTTRLQRLLAVVVAVFMAVCCLPLNAFAAGAYDEVTFTVWFIDGSHPIGEPEVIETKTDGEGLVDLNALQYKNLPSDYIVDKSNPNNGKKAVDSGEELNVYVTKKPVEPQWQDSIYEVNFVNQETGKSFKTTKLNSSVLEGQNSYLLANLNTTIQSVLDEGYDLVKVELADGTPVDDKTVMVAGTDNKVTVYVVAKKTEPEWQDSIYEVNFVNQETGKTVKSTKLNSSVLEGQDSYLLANLKTTIQSVLDEGYDLVKVELVDGTPVDDKTVMVAGTDNKVAVYVVPKKTEPEWQDAIYELNFVDQDGKNVESFQHNGTVMKGQTTYLLAAVQPSIKTVLDQGYDLRKVEFSSGDPVDETTVMTAGNVGADKHKLVVHVTKKATSSGSTSDNNNNNNNNNNTTTSAVGTNAQVVKASAPAANTAKILPQTGVTAETPVVFGVMIFAALAGAGAYLFALRKKLN